METEKSLQGLKSNAGMAADKGKAISLGTIEPVKKGKRERFDPLKHSKLSRPVIRQKKIIYTLQAQRVVEKMFERTCSALFSTDVILQVIADEADAEQATSFVNVQFADLIDDIENNIVQIKTLLKESGNEIDSLEMEYTNPKRIEVFITSPTVGQYSKLLSKFDQFICLIDIAWMYSLIESKERTKVENEWQNKIKSLSSKIITREVKARRAVAAKNAEALKEAEEKAKSKIPGGISKILPEEVEDGSIDTSNLKEEASTASKTAKDESKGKDNDKSKSKSTEVA